MTTAYHSNECQRHHEADLLRLAPRSDSIVRRGRAHHFHVGHGGTGLHPKGRCQLALEFLGDVRGRVPDALGKRVHVRVGDGRCGLDQEARLQSSVVLAPEAPAGARQGESNARRRHSSSKANSKHEALVRGPSRGQIVLPANLGLAHLRAHHGDAGMNNKRADMADRSRGGG